MMPPRCIICKKRFSIESGKSGGIYFKKTEEEIAYMQRMKDERRVGHPKGYGWFCIDHYRKAKTLKNGFLHDAVDQFKETEE